MKEQAKHNCPAPKPKVYTEVKRTELEEMQLEHERMKNDLNKIKMLLKDDD